MKEFQTTARTPRGLGHYHYQVYPGAWAQDRLGRTRWPSQCQGLCFLSQRLDVKSKEQNIFSLPEFRIEFPSHDELAILDGPASETP